MLIKVNFVKSNATECGRKRFPFRIIHLWQKPEPAGAEVRNGFFVFQRQLLLGDGETAGPTIAS